MTDHADLIERLHDEADLCANEVATDIAALLREAAQALAVPATVSNHPECPTQHHVTDNDRMYGVLSDLAGLDTHDVNLRDNPKAYEILDHLMQQAYAQAAQALSAPAAPAAQKRERKLATMWLCAHYADEYTNEQIEALCWEILGIKTRDQAMSIAAPAAPAPQADGGESKQHGGEPAGYGGESAAPFTGLSAEDQARWAQMVADAQGSIRMGMQVASAQAVLAVDALLRQRREPISEARINSILDASGPAEAHEWHQGHFLAFARAVEAAHGIGTGEAA